MSERIDFHSHILPNADHGSDSVETSLAQLALLCKAGVDAVVATPHFYPQRRSLDDFLARRNKYMRRLLEAYKDPSLRVYIGAEVLICPGMENMEGLERLCVEGTNVLLLELPLERIEEGDFNTVAQLSARKDLRIVLAHIDRYAPDDVEALMELPVEAQINASSLCSMFKRRKLSRYFKEERVWALASDLHMADASSVNKYLKGLSKIGPAEEARVNERARTLLEKAIPMQDL